MEVQALPVTMTEEQAMEIAQKKGNLLGRMLIRDKDITLKLIYLESKELIFQMTYASSPLSLRRKLPVTQKICILVEGTRCSPAFLDRELETVSVQVEDECQLQACAFPEEKVVEAGKLLARRMVRRQSGRNVSLAVKEIRSLYRPFYVVFYGEMKEGTKVRYLPIPADGNEVRRTL